MKPIGKDKIAYHILRVGIAVTYIWIGVYILRDPLGWSGFLKPWVQDLLIFSPEKTMILSGSGNVVIGLLLLLDFWPIIVWLGSVFASLHVIVVFITVGIDATTVRDIAIFVGSTSLAITLWPENIWPRK